MYLQAIHCINTYVLGKIYTYICLLAGIFKVTWGSTIVVDHEHGDFHLGGTSAHVKVSLMLKSFKRTSLIA